MYGHSYPTGTVKTQTLKILSFFFVVFLRFCSEHAANPLQSITALENKIVQIQINSGKLVEAIT